MSDVDEPYANVTIDLHPESALEESSIRLSKFEVESLYKTLQIVNGDNKVLLEQNERLREENRLKQETIRTNQEAFQKEKDELRKKLHEERRKNTSHEQEKAMFECQVRQLEDQLAEVRQRETYDADTKKLDGEEDENTACPITAVNPPGIWNIPEASEPCLSSSQSAYLSQNQRYASAKNSPVRMPVRPETLTGAEQPLEFSGFGSGGTEAGAEGGAVMMQTLGQQQPEQENVDNEFRSLDYHLDAVYKEMSHLKQEALYKMKKATEAEQQYKASLAHYERKLKHANEANERLLKKNQSLERQNHQLRNKLRNLEDKKEDYNGPAFQRSSQHVVNSRRSGRFVVNHRSVECMTCHETFVSKDEMRSTFCRFHSARPVPSMEDRESKYWSCCNTTATKVPRGCRIGKHKSESESSNKRPRSEE